MNENITKNAEKGKFNNNFTIVKKTKDKEFEHKLQKDAKIVKSQQQLDDFVKQKFKQMQLQDLTHGLQTQMSEKMKDWNSINRNTANDKLKAELIC